MKTTFSLKEVFRISWENTKKHIWFLILSTFVYFVAYAILTNAGKGSSSIFIGIASGILSLLFSIGMYRIGLLMEEGKNPVIADFKTAPETFLSTLWASIIIGFFTFIGFILFVVPGFIVMVRLSLTTFLILDKKLKGWDAVKESWKITKGFSWKIFGFFVVCFLIMFVGVIPFGIGLVLAVPFVYITGAVLYRKIQKSRGEVDNNDVTITPVEAESTSI